MIRLHRRAAPLPVAGALALGEAARAMARRLAARPEACARLAGVEVGVAPHRGIVLVGEALAIPWAPGVIWLGREPDAPALLVPTRLAVAPHAALVVEALRRRTGDPHGSFVLAEIAGAPCVVPLAAGRTPGGEELSAWTA